MKLMFCGGAAEVGASCVLIKMAGRNLVFDSGMRMGQNKDLLPDMRMIQENGGVDAIFISHAHMDHIGSLPVLSNAFPQACIYMTQATKDLMRVLLYDSLKIMENREQEIPLFSEVHVKNTLDRVLCYSPGYSFRPFPEETAVTFFNAGHIAGAVAIYVAGDEGAFFYSGDFSINPQRTVEGASIPRLRPDVAVFESTYGDRLHANREIEEQRLVAKVNEVLEAGKKILIPAFALGRAQEVVLILKRAINKGELASGKIYVDGMVNDICRVYGQNPNYLSHLLAKRILKGNEIFYDDHVIAVTGRQAQREEIIASKDPCCIISSSGMLTGGPSQWYAGKLAGDDGNFIALTGYQDEESPGHDLLALAEGNAEERVLKIGDVSVSLNCGIGKYGLSAHADKTEILSLVHSLAPRNAFFVHGNPEVTVQLAKEIQKELRGRVYAPGNGEEFDLKINVPRKQLIKDDLLTMENNEQEALISEEELPKLWAFIAGSYPATRGFTFEEMGYIWTGKRDLEPDELAQVAHFINNSIYFQAENKRPFIFHARSAEDIKAAEEPAHMEVNSMLALVDKYFSPETGLYKKGARFTEKIALLNFAFPKKARQFRDQIDSFERETGWRVEINTECNQLEAQNMIKKLFSAEEEKIDKISYLPLDDAFKVKVNKEVNRKGDIIKEFMALTGLSILIESPAGSDKGGLSSSKPNNRAAEWQMEQNQALQYIQDAFAEIPDKIYKKSIKNEERGGYIELSFLSPDVGNRYRSLIEKLEKETGWCISISPSVNQHEGLNIAKKILDENGVVLKRSIAFMPKEMQAVAFVAAEPGNAGAIREEYERLTGLQLLFKVTQ